MPVLKSRPRVRVRVPTEIRPGDEFRATVVLDAKRPVDVERIDVRLDGVERWQMGSGNTSTGRTNPFLSLGARVAEARTIPAGHTELSVFIPLPADAPPTYRGAVSVIDYTLHVHVAIPWWADRRASFDVFVAPTEVPSPPSEPGVFSSDPSGPKGTEPHAEVSVASTWTRSGDIVNGAIALSNVAHHRYSEIRAGLRGLESIHDGGRPIHEREYLRYQIRLGAEQAGEGEMIPFRFRLPPEAMPDLAPAPRPNGQPALCSLAWQLEVVVGIRWGADLILRVPYRVLPASPRPADAPSRLAPPTVGSDRLREIWEAVGAQHGLRYDTQTLYGALGGTTLSIRRDLSGRAGVFLVAELSYPELQLGLDVAPATKLQQMVGGGAVVGDPSWDREHYVRARDEAQAAELLRVLVPAMRNAALRHMDDRRLVLEVRDAGSSRARMEAFVAAAAQLARAVEAARQAIPPPPAMRDALPVWRELATRLGATLEPARMRVEGQLGAMSVEVRTAFTGAGQPLATWLSVIPPSPLDAGHTLTVRGGDRAQDQLETRFAGETLELVKILAHGAYELAIEPGRVAVGLPYLLGVDPAAPACAAARALPTIRLVDAPPAWPSTAVLAEQRLSRLAQLVAVLRGHVGPYR
ncbi:MAG: hypothetical protein KF729_06150 [Sandaracinaceae bacterium]|nr:hypothetical protein [Sandaracinaceae bacterium]